MSTTTKRPNATTDAGSSTIGGGAASRHAAVSDDDIATYVTAPQGTGYSFGFPAAGLPAGALLKRADLRVRWGPTGNSTLSWGLTVGGDTAYGAAYRASGAGYITSVLESISTDEVTPLSVVLGSYLSTPKVYEVFLDLVYVAKPVVNVTAPIAPTTNLVTLEWEETLDVDGGAQTLYEAKLFDSATYGGGGFDPETSDDIDHAYDLASSGAVGAETVEVTPSGAALSWTSSVPLADGTYRAYVRAAQTVNGAEHWSDWDYLEFTVATPRPGVPMMTLTPEDSEGRIKIALSANAGDVTTNAFEVQRQLEGGEWEWIRTVDGDGRSIGGTPTTLYDLDAPNETIAYRARAVHLATEVVSDWTATDYASQDDSSWRMIHPYDTSLTLAIELRSWGEQTRPARQSVKQPLGRPDAVVISDVRGAEQGNLVVRGPDDDTRDALKVLADSGAPIFLRAPALDHEPSRWIALGDETIARAVDKSWIDERDVSYSWVAVARPTDDLLAWPDAIADPDPEELVLL